MYKRSGLAAWGAALVTLGAAQGASAVFSSIYSTDFEDSVDAVWSTTSSATDAVFSRFLGRFGNGQITLTQNTVAGEQYRVTFDLYLIDRWRGDQGNDYFTLSLDGATIISDTFDNRGGAQSYAGAPESGGADLGFGTREDSIYRSLNFIFNAAGAQTVVAFGASGLPNNTNNASWGIDNVRVEQWFPVIPGPGSQILAAAGFSLLIFSRPIRRQAALRSM